MNPGSTLSTLAAVINLDTYPLHEPESAACQTVISKVHEALKKQGCSILEGFIRQDAVAKLEQQGESIADKAYYTVETVNAYNIALDHALPPDHPAQIRFERGNAFVARDVIPADYMIQQLYGDSLFKQFIARCFSMDRIYQLADPLAGLCLNVLQQGRAHPWHFDTNEFTVSLLTKAPDQGGVFEYCPNIRSPEAENFTQVRQVLENNPDMDVKRLALRCGDLQLFKGRHSLHRVTTVKGKTERHSAIFAYTPTEGVIGKTERTRQLFGRVLPEHYAAETQQIRNDRLID